jgi:hypothetical protein
MSELQQRREIEAFFNFFSTFNLARPVSAVSDLADGAALFQVLSLVYDLYLQYFMHSLPFLITVTRVISVNPSDHRASLQRTGSCDLAPSNVYIVS